MWLAFSTQEHQPDWLTGFHDAFGSSVDSWLQEDLKTYISETMILQEIEGERSCMLEGKK